ncbi:MAG: caspase family protein [Chloroflexi bacterium]|nr:caspase family protein [Chloroflexota bacterium]
MTLFTHGHALLIGVGGEMPGTAADAEQLAALLTDPGRCAYPPEQVAVLTAAAAGRPAILAGLERLARAAAPRSTALVYFSGHGYRVASSSSDAYFLLPHGYDLARLAETAISGQELAGRLAAIPAGRLLILLDCCHAGGIGEARAPGLAFTKAPLPQEALALLQQGRGRVLIASSRADELSFAGDPLSAFTLALAEALCGSGAARQDGTVRVADLALHAREMVPQRTGARQHPILHFEQADNFTVAYYAAGAAQPKGVPFARPPEIEPAPGAWRSGPRIRGDQIRAGGPVAARGSALNTGPGVAFVGDGNIVITGSVGGDVHRKGD